MSLLDFLPVHVRVAWAGTGAVIIACLAAGYVSWLRDRHRRTPEQVELIERLRAEGERFPTDIDDGLTTDWRWP